MEMATATLKSPVTGTVTGKAVYCQCPGDVCAGSGATHGSCNGGSSKYDIDAGDGEAIKLRVNYPTVKSIETWVYTSGAAACCESTSCASKFKRTIVVDLFSQVDANAGSYIGTVLYGHIDNPVVSHGQVINLSSGVFTLGYAASGSCTGCSTGSHVHMEKWGGSANSYCCCTTVTTSNVLYSWNF
jgi:hypothetical protein